jgi:UDP-N-acetyl-D-glucosamine/UDP-N-acetyl-D-galactosamine dehydrogenase
MSMKRSISVIGLGYVGLPVAVAFSKKAKVIGFDIYEQRLTELRNGKDSTCEVEPEDLKEADIHFTSNPDDLRQADFHIIAVPTPINEAKQPDLRALLAATKTVGNVLKSGDIVVYESTVYPGCTEEDCAPILEKQSALTYINSNISCNLVPLVVEKEKGFFLGYSPERINPGDKEHTFTTIKKLISGSTPEATKIIAETYSSVVTAGVYEASSIKVAEAAKIIENAQRDLNIAFVNELALIFNRLDIDTLEVLEAAGTKWNFLPFRPGLVGGHCIGIDPYYLTYSAERSGYHPQIILAGRRINDSLGIFIAKQVIKELASVKIGSIDAKVAVLGITFKENCPDLRNSRVPEIIDELEQFGCSVSVYDSYCNPEEAFSIYGIRLDDEKQIRESDAIVLAVPHNQYCEWDIEHWKSMLIEGGVVIDIKNVTPSKALRDAGYTVWKL